MSVQLGRLEKVELKETWPHEAKDFTPWLANPENIKLLQETLGLELEVVSVEKNVGSFFADILCKDISSDQNVLIENQLDKTDHTHLGQIFTYAAGLDALTIIWIAKEFREEHRAAVDWLNSISKDNINFFGLEIELWKIGNSPIAPRFNIISRPNGWTRVVRESPELTDTQKLQIELWTRFKEYMEANSPKISCSPPYHQNWITHSLGISGVYIASVASTWNSEKNDWSGEVRVELVMGNRDADNYYEALIQQKDIIERSFHSPLVWHKPESAIVRKIYIKRDTDFRNKDCWNDLFKWYRSNVELFFSVFKPLVSDIKKLNSYSQINTENASDGEPPCQ